MGGETVEGEDGGRVLNTAAVIGAGTMGRQIVILALIRRAREHGVRGAFLLPSRHSDEELRLDERFRLVQDLVSQLDQPYALPASARHELVHANSHQ